MNLKCCSIKIIIFAVGHTQRWFIAVGHKWFIASFVFWSIWYVMSLKCMLQPGVQKEVVEQRQQCEACAAFLQNPWQKFVGRISFKHGCHPKSCLALIQSFCMFLPTVGSRGTSYIPSWDAGWLRCCLPKKTTITMDVDFVSWYIPKRHYFVG